MSLPTPQAVGKAVLMTAVAIVVLNVVKPYLPAPVRNLLTI